MLRDDDVCASCPRSFQITRDWKTCNDWNPEGNQPVTQDSHNSAAVGNSHACVQGDHARFYHTHTTWQDKRYFPQKHGKCITGDQNPKG